MHKSDQLLPISSSSIKTGPSLKKVAPTANECELRNLSHSPLGREILCTTVSSLELELSIR